MTPTGDSSTWTPPWVYSLGTGVWISGPDHQISYINERALQLLGKSLSECLGQPCYMVVAGRDAMGNLYCTNSCPVTRLASQQSEIEPMEMQVPGPDGMDRWIKVLAIPVTAADGSGPWLVHCVLDESRAHRIEEYLTKVSSRSTTPTGQEPKYAHFALSRREMQILDLLADDETLHGIAATLHLSHATVRNHVQHILSKLGVHSIMEAVAYYLLAKE